MAVRAHWHHASRGSTFVVLDNKIIDSIYAFNKFFNLHEYPNYMGITSLDYMKQLESQGFSAGEEFAIAM